MAEFDPLVAIFQFPFWRAADQNVMSKLAVAAVLAIVIASPALAQSFDPHIGSGNLSPTVESGGFYLPPVPSGVCEVPHEY
jgi:hypothetical protein